MELSMSLFAAMDRKVPLTTLIRLNKYCRKTSPTWILQNVLVSYSGGALKTIYNIYPNSIQVKIGAFQLKMAESPEQGPPGHRATQRCADSACWRWPRAVEWWEMVGCLEPRCVSSFERLGGWAIPLNNEIVIRDHHPKYGLKSEIAKTC